MPRISGGVFWVAPDESCIWRRGSAVPIVFALAAVAELEKKWCKCVVSLKQRVTGQHLNEVLPGFSWIMSQAPTVAATGSTKGAVVPSNASKVSMDPIAPMPFIAGKVYKRQDLHLAYGGQRQCGISTPAKLPFIFLFSIHRTSKTNALCDRWDNGLYYFLGEGNKETDMKMQKCNKALKDHLLSGKRVLLFVATSKHQSGYVECIGEVAIQSHEKKTITSRIKKKRKRDPIQEEPDSSATTTPSITTPSPSPSYITITREVIVFCLVPVGWVHPSSPHYVPELAKRQKPQPVEGGSWTGTPAAHKEALTRDPVTVLNTTREAISTRTALSSVLDPLSADTRVRELEMNISKILSALIEDASSEQKKFRIT